MQYIKLKKALHIVDVISSDEGIRRKCKAIRKRLKELPTEDVEKVKAEAVKEFAERLKERVVLRCFDPMIGTKIALSEDDLENLVKEMVGEGL